MDYPQTKFYIYIILHYLIELDGLYLCLKVFGSAVKNVKEIRPKKMKIPKPISTLLIPYIGISSPERITKRRTKGAIKLSVRAK